MLLTHIYAMTRAVSKCGKLTHIRTVTEQFFVIPSLIVAVRTVMCDHLSTTALMSCYCKKQLDEPSLTELEGG